MNQEWRDDKMEEKRIAVPVATLWTTFDSPREIDSIILGKETMYENWLSQLTYDERLELCSKNLVQSQALFNDPVLILEETNGWSKVILLDQPTVKAEAGYPGWIPSCQLSSAQSEVGTQKVRVKRNTAPLFNANHELLFQLSFGTTLVVKQAYEHFLHVDTPLGEAVIKQADIEWKSREKDGNQLVDSARQFIGLPYLWGGMSGFGYDCSGFVYAMHKASAIIIPRDASNQVQTGIEIKDEDVAVGDLLYFAHDKGEGAVHHVAMYAGDGEMIHAPKTGKAVEQISFHGTEYEQEYCATRRFTSKALWRDFL